MRGVKVTQRRSARLEYCTSWNFRGGFIFTNFASQTLAKISTSINTSRITIPGQNRENNYVKIMVYTVCSSKMVHFQSSTEGKQVHTCNQLIISIRSHTISARETLKLYKFIGWRRGKEKSSKVMSSVMVVSGEVLPWIQRFTSWLRNLFL